MKLPEKGTVVPLSEIKKLCKSLSLFDVLKIVENDLPEKPFKSDGCSCWPDNWKNSDGEKVCLYEECFGHDLRYWSGKKGDFIARFLSDVALLLGVVLKTRRPGLALIMFLGVRIGGVSWIPSPFKWSFGRV